MRVMANVSCDLRKMCFNITMDRQEEQKAKHEFLAWFVYDHNSFDSNKVEPKGPFHILEIKEQIKTGLLRKEALVCRSGQSEWLKAEKEPYFCEIFKDANRVSESRLDSPFEDVLANTSIFVITQRLTVQNRQWGPMSKESFYEALKVGHFRLDDLIWFEGLPNWKKIDSFDIKL
jgi:hypothetical protein